MKERKGIAVAGNLLVDRLMTVSAFPASGEICTILEEQQPALGGAACNVAVDLARLDPNVPVEVYGVVGEDENGALIRQVMGREPSINLDALRTADSTAYTLVMQDQNTKQRTFFTCRGANALFDEECIDWEKLDARLLHVGYALLLDRLDAADEKYGTRMARLLHHAQSLGIITSLDVVSEAGERMARLIPSALPYVTHFVINEWEAQQITGVPLEKDGVLLEQNMPEALRKIRGMGVSGWIVVHSPMCCYGMDEQDHMIRQGTLCLPANYIRGTVGAGDAFCAGVLYGAYREQQLEQAMQLGICAAACALSAPGSSEGLRPVDEALKLMQQFGVRA